MANKLYPLSYISENIEQFATQMLLSAVDNHVSELEHLQPGYSEQRTEGMVGFNLCFDALSIVCYSHEIP